MSWKAIDRYSKDYIEMSSKKGVKFYKTPDAILRKQLAGLGQDHGRQECREPVVQEGAGLDARIRRRACRWQNDTTVDHKMAYNHFFAKKG
jgi:TRAP-type mannitol/chloroaromatic compound transport system substrate-binding protein